MLLRFHSHSYSYSHPYSNPISIPVGIPWASHSHGKSHSHAHLYAKLLILDVLSMHIATSAGHAAVEEKTRVALRHTRNVPARLSIVTMAISCLVSEIWPWDGQRTDDGPTSATIEYRSMPASHNTLRNQESQRYCSLNCQKNPSLTVIDAGMQ